MKAAIVGSGPNGLAAAITLAQTGYSVDVFEAEATIGGGVRSAELTLPGFIHDRCSAVYPLAVGSPFFQALPLSTCGLQWIHPDIPLAHPIDANRVAVLRSSLQETVAELGEDGPVYRRMFEPFVDHWAELAHETLQPVCHVPRHPLLLAQFGILALQSAAGLARRAFRTETARALFAGLAAHSFLSLEAWGSAAFGLILGAAGHAVGWPIPRGGAQQISDALAGRLRELGGRIETERRISDLRELPSLPDVTLLDLTAWPAARVARTQLPAAYRRQLERFPHGPAVFKVDYALSEAIPWRHEACRRAGTIHVGGTLSEVSESERRIAEGRLASRPFVLVAQPSVFDDTRAPAGKHTAWAYCHVPRGWKEDCSAAIEAQIERFAPGFKDCILARSVSDPSRLEAGNANLVDGDITGGACTLRGLMARPTFGRSPYRTPVPGLFLCSSSTPPGGGVHGMCGYHAARAAMKSKHC